MLSPPARSAHATCRPALANGDRRRWRPQQGGQGRDTGQGRFLLLSHLVPAFLRKTPLLPARGSSSPLSPLRGLGTSSRLMPSFLRLLPLPLQVRQVACE